MFYHNVTPLVTSNNFEENPINQYGMSKFMKFDVDMKVKNMENFQKVKNALFWEIKKMPTHEVKSLLIAEFNVTNRQNEVLKIHDNDCHHLLLISLDRYPNPVGRFNDLIEYKNKWVLSEAYLNWFKDDLLASLFLASFIEESIKGVTKRGRNEFLSAFELLIKNSIEYFNKSFYQKKLYQKILDAKSLGNTSKIELCKNIFLLNQIKTKEIKWIDIKSAEQVEWVYCYLEEKELLVLQSVFFPIDIAEKYDHIVASLTVLSNDVERPFKTIQKKVKGLKVDKDFSEREWCLYQLKKAWASKVNRSKTAKTNKEKTIKIYQKNYEDVQKLAKENDMTLNKYVNQLIETEIQRFKSESVSEFEDESENKDDNLSETKKSELDKELS